MNDLSRDRRYYAYIWNALPRYVFQDKDGNWRNFEHEIVYQQDYFNPVQYYNRINQDAILPLSLTTGPFIFNDALEDILIFYVIGNHFLHNQLKSGFASISDIILRSGMDEDTGNRFEKLWSKCRDARDYGELINKVNAAKKSFRQQYEDIKREEEKIQRIEAIPFTEFEVDTVVKVYEISEDIIIGNIYALFNKIKVDPANPLVVTPLFYKVLKGYEYAIDIPDDPDTMYVFTTTGKVEINKNAENIFEISYEFKKDEDDSFFLKSICALIGLTPEDVNIKSERINGISQFTRQTLSSIIWRDFVMNNPTASRYLVMDEHQINVRRKKTTRQVVRKGFYAFYMEGDTKTSFTIRENENGEGVRIRILNAVSYEKATLMLLMIAKMMTLYNQVAPEIAKEYNEILKSNTIQFIPPASSSEDEKPKLKKIAKEMFLSNYTRKCGFLPEIVSDPLKYEAANIPVMRFPKEGDEVDGKYFNFVCNHHENHVFPGLRKNPFENNTRYPLLPCCYRQDQNLKRTSMFKEYYNTNKKLKDFKPTELDEVQNIQYRFLISDKFVGFEQTGKCSDVINNLFMIYTEVKPVRKGVHRSRQSALECVLVATQYEDFHKKDSKTRLMILTDEMIRLSESNLTICAQECWDVKDPSLYLELDQYFDPKYMIRLLETVYKCRIVIFSREDFVHPNCVEGYLRWKNDPSLPVVLLYEHFGSEADEATYPQCEWITFTTDVSQTEKNHILESIYQDYLSSFETIQHKSYPSEKYFTNLFQPEYTLISQHIDFYGKVFALNVKDSNNRRLTFFIDDYRLPVFSQLPRATNGYFLPNISTNIFNRQKIELENYVMYIYSESNPINILDEYENTRQQVELITENAKRIYSNRLLNGLKEDWSFIQVNPDLVIKYSKYLFSDSNVIFVPNRETKKRLIYTLRLYATRSETALLTYPSFKENIPFKFRSVHDFEPQEDAIIVENSTTINWFSDFYVAKPLDGTLYTDSFVAVLQGKSFKCNPLEDEKSIQTDQYVVYFPQMKKIYVVGDHPNRKYLVLKNLNQILKWYECIPFV